MWKTKDVYYISDSTALLVEDLGRSLLCQFPEIGFHEEKIPFVRDKSTAEQAIAHILEQSGGLRPLLFCTIMDEDVRSVFDRAEVEMFDLYGGFLDRLERKLEARALHQPGFFRTREAKTDKRVAAIHYTLDHHDGQRIDDYNEADIILIGVSRTGKTPVSVYLATHMGLKAANFPMTSDHLKKYELPQEIVRNKERAVGLTVSPQYLHNIREKRYKGSRYAQLNTCRDELTQAEQLYMQHGIMLLHTENKSIEELSVEATRGIVRKKKRR